MKVIVRHDPRFRGMAMWLYEELPNGYRVVNPVDLSVTTEVGEGWELPDEPTFRFDGRQGHEFLQSLADALVDIGIRANDLKAQNLQIDAMKYHLEDMRKLVFKGK